MNRLWIRLWLGAVLTSASAFGLLLLAAIALEARGGNVEGGGTIFALGLVAAGLAGLGVSAALARHLARPVERLSEAARLVAGGHFETRTPPPVGAPHEIARLVRDFNAMAEALEALEDERRATAAAIAHELRTPLAVVQARLEAVRDGVVRPDAAEIDLLLRHTRLLARLVEDLRLLSLAQAGRLTVRTRPGDFARLLREAAAAFAPFAAARRIRLVLRLDAVTAPLDEGRAQQVIAALLDNALRHTPPGGEVQIVLARRPDEATLEVRDSGEGFAPHVLPRAFERFSGASRGTGLGLAVVKALVEAHGGRAEAGNRPEGGAWVRTRWPAPEGRPSTDDG